MLKNRALRKSLYNFVVSLFTSPPAATGWTPFNAYSENQLRQYDANNFAPVAPYIFIVDSFIAPTQITLPMIVIEISTLARPFELGNTGGRLSLARLHTFGRNRGQRDDISSMLQDVFAGTMITSGSVAPFPVYDFPSAGSSVFVETAHIDTGVNDQPQSVGESETFESSLLNWNEVSFTFQTKE